MIRTARIIAFAALAWLSSSFACLAQSGPNWPQGYVPTPAEWQFWWTHKLDYNGATACLVSGCTFSGELITAASTVNNAGFNIPPGVAPTVPNNGDIWETTSGIFVRINGTTYNLIAPCPNCAVTNATNIFTAAQDINLNAASLPTALSGTALQIGGADAAIARIEADAVANPGVLSFTRADGTRASQTAVQANEEIGSVNGWAYNGSSFVGGIARISIYAGENISSGHQGSYIRMATTPIASTTLTDRIGIENDGGVTLPPSVAGGSKGAGSVNASVGFYVNGSPLQTTAGALGTILQGQGVSTAPSFTATPSLGAAGSVAGTLGFANTTSGSVTLQTVAGALGSSVASLPVGTYTLAGLSLNETFSGNQTFSGQAIHTGTSAPASAAGNTVIMGTIAAPTLANNGQAFLYNTAINGGVLQGQGSTYDAALADNAGSVAIGVSTGTVNAVFAGKIGGASISTTGTIGGSICRTAGGDFIYTSGVNCFTSGAATSLAPGTTTISPSNPGYALTNAAGIVSNNSLFSTAGGLINKIRNPGFDVWNRGTSVTISATGNYGPDGWKIAFTGSSTVGTSQGGQFIVGGSGHNLTINGAASNTGIQAVQRIESFVAAPMTSQTVTFSLHFFQNTGSTVTPKLSTCFASATDNFTTCTADLAATSLQSCATSTICTLSYTFAVSSSANNGYQITFDCNASYGAGTACEISDVDLRVTPGVTTGLNSNPPLAEIRNVGFETAFNARYFRALARDASVFIWTMAAAPGSTNLVDYNYRFDDVPMRVAPTLTTSGTATDYLVSAGDGTSSGACTSVPSLIFSTTGSAFIRFTRTSSGLTANTMARQLGANANAILWLSAEL